MKEIEDLESMVAHGDEKVMELNEEKEVETKLVALVDLLHVNHDLLV